MRKYIYLAGLIFVSILLCENTTNAHRAEHEREQAQVDDQRSLNDYQKHLKEREDIARKRLSDFDEWEKEKDPKKRMKLYIERFSIELMVLASIVVSGLNFFIGRKLNQRLAQKWLDNVQKTLVDGYTFIPEDCKSDDGRSIENFLDPTSKEFPLSLSGRETCKFTQLTLITKSRHDIATNIFSYVPIVNRMVSKERDTLWIEIPIQRSTKIVSEILLIQQKEVEQAQ